MSDRISHFTVVLAEDMREEEARSLADAIELFHNVDCVQLGAAVSPNELIARARVRREMGQKLLKVLTDD